MKHAIMSAMDRRIAISHNLRITFTALLLLVSGGVLAGADHGGVSAGPLTSLTRLESAVALASKRAEVPSLNMTPKQWVTPEGLRVMLWQSEQLPMLDVRLIFDAGAARDGALPGLASAVSSLMDEGTEKHSGESLAAGFESLGAEFSAQSYRDMAVLQLRVLSDPAIRDPAITLMTEVAADPAFSNESWSRLQGSMRIGQRQRQQSPASRASLLFYTHLYGDHPYANPPTGLLSGINRINTADMKAFHQRFYTAGNATLVMVGKIDVATAEVMANYFSSHMRAGVAAPDLPEPAPRTHAQLLFQTFPSQQVHTLIGALGIKRTDPDFFALQVANELLGGGGFGSLLTRELRERRGLTYSVTSSFLPMHATGPFIIAYSTRADQADFSLQLTQGLLRDFIANTPNQAAVQGAIDNLAQSFPRDVGSNANMSSYLGLIGFYGLPTDYISTYVAQLRAVTAEGVQQALARHLDPERLLIVSVGAKVPQAPPPTLQSVPSAAQGAITPL